MDSVVSLRNISEASADINLGSTEVRRLLTNTHHVLASSLPRYCGPREGFGRDDGRKALVATEGT